MNDWLVIVVLAQAITAAVPLMLAATGECLSQRVGTLNVGMEGWLLSACIAAFAGTALSGSAMVGVFVAVITGVAMAALFAWVAIVLRTDQIVAGMAINLLAVGASGTTWALLQRSSHDYLQSGQGITRGLVPGLSVDAQRQLADLPLIGPLIFDQYLLLPVAVIVVIASFWVLRRTRTGIIMQALGDAPVACTAAGIGVVRWRVMMLLLAGALAGLAGAYLSIMRTHGFAPLMTGGMGFVVLALVIFGRWRPLLVAGTCLGFGVIDAVQSHLQGHGLNAFIPYQFFQALPFLIALLALAVMRAGDSGPRQLGRPAP